MRPIFALLSRKQAQNCGSGVALSRRNFCGAVALGRLAHSGAVGPLVDLLDDEFNEVRRQAALALGYIGEREANLPLLQLVTREPVASVREAALYAMDLLDSSN